MSHPVVGSDCSLTCLLCVVGFCQASIRRLKGLILQIEESIHDAQQETTNTRRQVKHLRAQISRALDKYPESILSRLEWTQNWQPASLAEKALQNPSLETERSETAFRPAPGHGDDASRFCKAARHQELMELFQLFLLA